jgi:hypothetical protein
VYPTNGTSKKVSVLVTGPSSGKSGKNGMMEEWNDGRLEGGKDGREGGLFHSSILPVFQSSPGLDTERFDSRGPEWYKSFIAT